MRISPTLRIGFLLKNGLQKNGGNFRAKAT